MESIEQQCSICNATASLLKVKDKWICEECLHLGIEKLVVKWKEPLNKLLKEYLDVCNQYLSADTQEWIPQARVRGLKIRAVLNFLGLPKDHVLFTAVRQLNRLFNKAREAEVFLVEMKENMDNNKTCTAMGKVAAKKKQKVQKQIQAKIPAILSDSFLQKTQEFLDQELVFYIFPIVKENVLFQYEERFQLLVDDFYRLAEEKGETAPDTFKALQAVHKGATSLRYIYQFLNEAFSDHYRDKETDYQDLQRKFNDLYDLESWFYQIHAYKKKLDAPKSEINSMQNSLIEKIQDLVDHMNIVEEPVKES